MARDEFPGPSQPYPREFLVGVEAALMGRRTFEPALTNPRWPSPNATAGEGMRLTPSLSADTQLGFERELTFPGGSVEIVYACR